MKTVATKWVNEVPTAKRSGGKVLRVLVRNQNFNQRSNHWSSSLMRQHSFLTKLLAKLENGEGQAVLDDLARLKKAIAHDHDLILHAAGLKDPYGLASFVCTLIGMAFPEAIA